MTEGVVIAVANQKGGVGKTTTAITLAAYLGLAGQRVLLVDHDPQGNATTGCGLPLAERSLYRGGVPVPTPWEGLSLVPMAADFGGPELDPDPPRALTHRLAPWRSQHDVLVIDCPPTLSLLPLTALRAADLLILPVQCEYFAMEGMAQLLGLVADIDAERPSPLPVRILLTMADRREALRFHVERDIRAHFGDQVFSLAIPRDEALAAAPSHGQPVTWFDPLSPGSIAYGAVAREVRHGIERHRTREERR